MEELAISNRFLGKSIKELGLAFMNEMFKEYYWEPSFSIKFLSKDVDVFNFSLSGMYHIICIGEDKVAVYFGIGEHCGVLTKECNNVEGANNTAISLMLENGIICLRGKKIE